MEAIVIYDSTGSVHCVTYGTDLQMPTGLAAVKGNVPEGQQVVGVDLTSAKTPVIKLEPMPGSDYSKIFEAINEVGNKVDGMVDSTRVLTTAAAISAETFTDEQALKVPGLYAEFDPNGYAYKTGMRFRYNDILYKVLQNHTSQTDWNPDNSPSLYAKILIPNPEAGPVAWEQPESTNGYSKGDKVTHKEKTWESLVDNNVWEPGTVGTETVWKEVVEEPVIAE